MVGWIYIYVSLSMYERTSCELIIINDDMNIWRC